MNTAHILLSAWTWNPAALLGCGAAFAAYLTAFGWNRRGWYLAAGLGVILIALVSPVNALADGYLFTAHMLQHILLLLIAPALLLLSLPPNGLGAGRLRWGLGALTYPPFGWAAGVGAMWFWHAPALCNAAASSHPIHAAQTLSLLALGGAFWWQTLAPREEDRLKPLGAVIYLFTACTACSVLGIILTFSPVTVCTVYMHPVDRLGIANAVRAAVPMEEDQQIGGLLMWVPMCLLYLGAIFGQLARWYGEPHAATEETR
jgi:putative membrane protein